MAISGKSAAFFSALLLWALLLPAQADESWVADELLKQINELRLEVAGLKQRIVALEQGKSNKVANTVPSIELSGFSLGSGDAPIAIVEFSDFQCGYCKRHNQSVFKQLKDNYVNTGKVRYYQRDLPLDFHADALPAAVAARCLGEQGFYWQVRDLLFSRTVPLKEAGFDTAARRVGADMHQYQACREEGKQQIQVTRDVQLGSSLGITGTPSFLIGKVRDGKLVDAVSIVGAQPYEVFVKAIQTMKGN